MVIDVAFVVFGLIILLLAGDALVRGAVNLSLRLGIPALIVSLTIVAFGTSAPELLISISAVRDGVPGLALGNIVGSNIANILLVLGLPALISTLETHALDTRSNYVYMMIGTAVFVGLAFMGPFGVTHGAILLALLAGILTVTIREGLRHMREVPGNRDEPDEEDPDMPSWKVGALLFGGLIGLPVGADVLVNGATNIARAFSVSETVIGLTLVALGTSLPELATTVMAAMRRQAEVAIGNVIGSNLFNLLAIIGITSLVGQIPVSETILRFDIWVMVAASVLLAPFIFTNIKMGRVIGAVLTLLYVAYVVAVFVI